MKFNRFLRACALLSLQHLCGYFTLLALALSLPINNTLIFLVRVRVRVRRICYSRQIAQYEQRNGGRGQVAGNHASCKQWRSSGR